MDQFRVRSCSKSVCTTDRCVVVYVPIFTHSKTICEIYFYSKFSDHFKACAIRQLLLMNTKVRENLVKISLGSAVKILIHLWSYHKSNKLSLQDYDKNSINFVISNGLT